MRKPRAAAAACPLCGRPAAPDTMPFCSRRCADEDLLAWLSHRYAIPASGEREDELDGESGGRAGPPSGETGDADEP